MKIWQASAVCFLASAVTACGSHPQSSLIGITARAGETRDYLQWPFPSGSIWNMPIHNSASYSSAGIQAAQSWGFAADEDILILTPNAPLKTVYVNTAGWDTTKTRCGTINYGVQLFNGVQVPVPDDFSTDPGYSGTTPNQSAAILMPDGVTVKQTQPLHVCGNGGTVTSGGDYVNGVLTAWEYPDDNLKTGDGIGGAHGGPRMSSIGGTLRVGEVRPGTTLHHALKLQIDGKFLTYNDDGSRGYRWPATAADGNASWYYTGTNNQMEIGALVALLPGFDVNGLRTQAAKILAAAFRDYGAYIADTTGWDTYQLTYEWGPAGRFTTQFKNDWGFDISSPPLSTCTDGSAQCNFSKDMADIMTQLQVIGNNDPSSIGGGATTDTENRRAAQAPPFVGDPPPATGGNLLQNPGFESDLTNWSTNGTTAAVSGGKTGSKSALLGSSGQNLQGEFQQGVSLQAGQSYTVTAYFKSAGSAWCSVGVKGSASAGWFDFHAEAGGTGFVQASTTFTAPSGISFANAYAWKTASTGTCTVDDLVVSLSGSSSSSNLAQNPGFENDFGSWSNTSGTNSILTSGARSGSKALELGSSGQNVQAERQQATNLQSGATYVLGAYFKNSGSAWCSVGIKGSASSGWFDFHAEAGGANYAQATTTFSAPSGISFANLYLWKTTSTGTCTADDVSLVKQ